MRFSLTLIVLIAALVFGMMTVVDGMQTTYAGEGDDTQTLAPTRGSGCLNDDGDDDLPPNEEPVDDPDSEDSEGGAEEGDPEDEDPYYEDDDCPAPPVPGDCGNMTAQGVYLFTDPNYEGLCVFFNQDVNWIDDYTCYIPPYVCWNDITSSAKLVNVPNGVFLCLHSFYNGNCEFVNANVPHFNVLFNEECGDPPPTCSLDNNLSSFYFSVGPPSVPGDGDGPEASFAAADADCDGGVGVSDALANLQHLSGFQVGCVGDWNGNAYQGDADCSGAIGAGDVTAILAVVATGSESAC